jgi:hypothetical protein
MHVFHDYVQQAWSREIPPNQNPIADLHIKLTRTTKALRAWSRATIPHPKLDKAVCREAIDQLEKAREYRQLSHEEKDLIRLLKSKILGLVAIQKSRARQWSRLTWLKKGDANTKYFYIIANDRKRKKFIHSLQSDEGWHLLKQISTS